MALGAVIGAVGGILGGREAGKGAEAAARSQVEAAKLGIEAQERATEQLRRDLAPYSSFGASALGPLSSALGITPTQTFEMSPLKPQTRPAIFQAPLPAPVIQSAPAQPEPAQPVSTEPELDPRTQSSLDSYVARAQELMRVMPDLWGDVRKDREGQLLGTLEAIRQISPSSYDRLVSESAQNAQRQAQEDVLTSIGLPSDAVEQTLGPYSPTQPQPVYEQPAQTFTPAPFQSRAESLMGGSENPLLQQAIQMRQDGSNVLQNPLLQAMQEDVTKRLMANQAARGKLGSGSTAESLQRSLIPMALDFREREIGGLTSMGTTLEDLRQREIDQLFRASGIGQASAARQGAAGLTAASNIGNLQGNIGTAQAQGAYGSALARNQMLGGLAYGAQGLVDYFGNKGGSDTSGFNFNPSFNPTVGEIFGGN